MATTIQSEVPMAGSVAKLVNRLSKVTVEDPMAKINDSRRTTAEKQLHIAIFEYKATQADELNLDVDDIIEIMKPVEDGWNRGKNERTGQVGMYPTNYCEVYRRTTGSNSSGVNKQYVAFKKTEGTTNTGEVPAALKRISGMEGMVRGKEETPLPTFAPLPSNLASFPPTLPSNLPSFPPSLPSISSSPPSLSKEESAAAAEKEYARVTFDYEAQHEDELSLKVGQTVWVVNKTTTDNGWYEGEVNGKRGLFPDNFVTLMKGSNGVTCVSSSQSSLPPSNVSSTSLPTSFSSSRDKPPAALPGAFPVMPLPPQVPAKPPKGMGGVSGVSGVSGSGSIGNGMNTGGTGGTGVTTSTGWKMSSSTTTLSNTPSTTSTATSTSNITFNGAPSMTSSVVKEEEKEVKALPTSFKDRQANLLASLNISSLNPSIPRPTASHSKSMTRIDQEGVSTENGELADKETPLLSHPTKNRPKVPSGVRRPVSMFPPQSTDYTSQQSKDGMTRSEMVVSDHPAPIGSSTSLSPSALSVSPPLPSKEKEKEKETSSIVSSSRSSTGTPTPILSTTLLTGVSSSPPLESVSSHPSQWVSRAEYNQLLAKMALLEERLTTLERR